MDGNSTHVSGNITKDPELRVLSGDRAVVNFTVARSWYTGEGENRENHVEYFDCVVWRDLARHFAASAKKGDRVMVDGILRQRSWEDKTTGDRRYKTEIEVKELGMSLRWGTAQFTATTGRAAQAQPTPVPVPVPVGAENDIEFEEIF